MKNEPYKYLIQTKDAFNDVLEYLDREQIFSLDLETNGKFNLFEVAITGVSLGFEDFGVYIPVAHVNGEQVSIDRVLGELHPRLLDRDKEVVYHNGVFDESVLSRYDIWPEAKCHDTMIMGHLYNENLGTHKLKNTVYHYLGYKMETYEEVVEKSSRIKAKRDYNFGLVPLEAAISYAADDAYWTYKLYRYLKKGLVEEKVWDCYSHIEAPLMRVVKDMRVRGVLIDSKSLDKAKELYPSLVAEIESEIFKEAGEVFNLNAPHEIGRVLFEKLRIGKNVPTTKSGQFSTDKKTLKIYSSHKIVENILRRKKIEKTRTSFVDGLVKYIDKDGRVRAEFSQIGTDTGRFSSKRPNLQNQEGDEVEDIKVRSFFIASPGNKLIVGDYSQIELRLIAHFSKDKNMTEAFLSEERDFHDEAARKMLEMQGIPIRDDEEVTPRQRFNAKSLNFGIPYGRGEGSVGEMLNVVVKCAHWPTWVRDHRMWAYFDPEWKEKELDSPIVGWTKKKEPNPNIDMCHNCGACFIEDWFAAFPNVRLYTEYLLDKARKDGFIRTLSGRKRRLEHINSIMFKDRTHAERQAFNTKIQGSAGDIIKLSMVQLAPKLKKLDTQILMTIHDELVFETPDSNAEEAVGVIKETMENPFPGEYPLRLPMVVDPTICERWSDGK